MKALAVGKDCPVRLTIGSYLRVAVMTALAGFALAPPAAAQFSVGEEIPWEAGYELIESLFVTFDPLGFPIVWLEQDPGRLFPEPDTSGATLFLEKLDESGELFETYYLSFVERVIMSAAYAGHNGAMVTALNDNVTALEGETGWTDFWTLFGKSPEEIDAINVVTAMVITADNFDFDEMNVPLTSLMMATMTPGNYTTFPALRPFGDVDGDNIPTMLEQTFGDLWIRGGLEFPDLLTLPAVVFPQPTIITFLENAGTPFAIEPSEPILWSHIERLFWPAGWPDGLLELFPDLSSAPPIVASNATAGVFDDGNFDFGNAPPPGVVPDTFYLHLAERIITDPSAPGHDSAMLDAYNDNYQALWGDVPSDGEFNGSPIFGNLEHEVGGAAVAGRTIALYATIVDLSETFGAGPLAGVSYAQYLRLLTNFIDLFILHSEDLTGLPALTPALYTFFDVLGPDGDPDGDLILNKDEEGFNPQSFVGNCLTSQAVNVGAGGGTVAHADGSSMTVPPGAVGSSTPFGIQRVGVGDPDFDFASLFTPGTFGIDPINVYRITNISALSGNTVALTVAYPDVDQDGFLDTTGFPELELQIWVFDVAANDFVALPDGDIDTVLNTIMADYTIPAGKAAGDILIGIGGSTASLPVHRPWGLIVTLLSVVGVSAAAMRRYAS